MVLSLNWSKWRQVESKVKLTQTKKVIGPCFKPLSSEPTSWHYAVGIGPLSYIRATPS